MLPLVLVPVAVAVPVLVAVLVLPLVLPLDALVLPPVLRPNVLFLRMPALRHHALRVKSFDAQSVP